MPRTLKYMVNIHETINIHTIPFKENRLKKEKPKETRHRTPSRIYLFYLKSHTKRRNQLPNPDDKTRHYYCDENYDYHCDLIEHVQMCILYTYIHPK